MGTGLLIQDPGMLLALSVSTGKLPLREEPSLTLPSPSSSSSHVEKPKTRLGMLWAVPGRPLRGTRNAVYGWAPSRCSDIMGVGVTLTPFPRDCLSTLPLPSGAGNKGRGVSQGNMGERREGRMSRHTLAHTQGCSGAGSCLFIPTPAEFGSKAGC